MKTTEKYVVVASKKGAGGSKVCCAATDKENAETIKEKLETHSLTQHLGPFKVILASEAERLKLYGD